MTRHPRAIERPRRRGAALVFVLVLLLVISMFCASLIRATVTVYRQRQRDEDRAQTVRLAEAGLARAQQKARQDAAYAGETWQLAGGELGVGRSGEVRIERLTESSTAAAKSFRVIAEFPMDTPLAIRMTLETAVSEEISKDE